MKKREARIQKAGGVIGGVIIVQAAAVLAIALPTGGIMTTRQI